MSLVGGGGLWTGWGSGEMASAADLGIFGS